MSNLPDAARMFEFWANHPQSIHPITILMSDRGIPRSWRHINSYGSHTFGLWNENGERTRVKWHFKTDQGVQCLTAEQAASMPPHVAQQDLVEEIQRRDFPSRTVKLQLHSETAARKFPINPFDLTKVLPHELASLQEIGKIVLNRNVENYLAKTEQASFAPSNLVPGICASPDKMLQARLLAYQDAHRYRVGVNHGQLSISAPRCPKRHYQRDGEMADLHRNQDSSVNFYPNDNRHSPVPNAACAPPPLPLLEGAWVRRYSQDAEDYFSQAGDLFRLMADDVKTRLASTIADGLSQADSTIQKRMLEYFGKAKYEYTALVRRALAARKS